jgi:hypothetical protein
LVKDYAKTLKDADSREIETSHAATVVKRYLNDPRIEKVAKRALWLGNDETHYLRKWESHDIDDLVNLIKATVNYIEIEHLSEGYVDSMPED